MSLNPTFLPEENKESERQRPTDLSLPVAHWESHADDVAAYWSHTTSWAYMHWASYIQYTSQTSHMHMSARSDFLLWPMFVGEHHNINEQEMNFNLKL